MDNNNKNWDTINISWNLLQGCNYSCKYCYEYSNKENHFFNKEKLIKTAYKILSLKYPYYIFTLTGGEPTIHPYLSELISYLYGTDLKIGIILATNGKRNYDYYRYLTLGLPEYSLLVEISVHLQYVDINNIINIIKIISHKKQLVSIKIMFDPQEREKLQKIYSILINLRNKIFFSMSICVIFDISNKLTPDYTQDDLNWIEKTNNSLLEFKEPIYSKKISQLLIKNTHLNINQYLSNSLEEYYCTDINLIQINNDEILYGSACQYNNKNLSLIDYDKEKTDLFFLCKAIKCNNLQCKLSINKLLPKFFSKLEAEEYINEYKNYINKFIKNKKYILPNPFVLEPTTNDFISSFLEKINIYEQNDPILNTESLQTLSIDPTPNLIKDYFKDICAIYEKLDYESQNIFLRAIKTLITGNQKYLCSSIYQKFYHPETNKKLKNFNTDKEELYTNEHIKITNLNTSLKQIKALSKKIKIYKPKLSIRLSHLPEKFIDTILYIYNNFPYYRLYMGNHSFGSWDVYLYGMPLINSLEKSPLIKSENNNTKISIIIPVYNSEKTIRRCIDSVLIQDFSNFEIIIIDDCSKDNTKEIIEEYLRRYPQYIHLISFSKNKGPGAARAAGLDVATGEYITFIDSDDIISEDFLKHGISICEEKQADIISFDMVAIYEDGKEKRWDVEPGMWDGYESLKQFLLKKTGCYGVVGRIYRKAMIHKHSIKFGLTPLHEDMVFSVSAFYFSEKTLVESKVGYYRYIHNDSTSNIYHGEKVFISFIEFISFLNNFFSKNNLDINDYIYKFCIERVYSWDRNAIFKSFYELDKIKKLKNFLSHDYLIKLGSSRDVISLILKDYATLHCNGKKIYPSLNHNYSNWNPKTSKDILHQNKFEYHIIIKKTSSFKPLLSVIITNYNKEKYIKKCINSILSQTNKSFEIVVIDDASTDESINILKKYAYIYPRISLYQMEQNQGQSVCQNIALNLVEGKYVTFIDADDWIEKDFFSYGLNIMEKDNPDILIFSVEEESLDQKEVIKKICKPLRINGKDACTSYWSDTMPWGTWGKIYSLKFIKDNSLYFKNYILHQDVHFLTYALYKSNLCITNELIMYHIQITPNSSIRPKSYSYIHAHSVYEKANLRMEIINKQLTYLEENRFYNDFQYIIEDRLLPCIMAFETYTGILPLSDIDYELIKQNKIFLFSLLIGFTYCKQTYSNLDFLLTKLPEHSYIDHIYNKPISPLVTVIIPTYNQEKYISRCINNVLKQSLRNIEIIIIDDASTDMTNDICKYYQEKDKRITVINNKENKGQGFSRNLALDLAKGKYITFIDSDDYPFHNFLLSAVTILKYNINIDIIHFSYRRDDLNGNRLKWETQNDILYTGREALKLYCMGKLNSWAVWSKVYRKDFLQKNQIKSPECLFEDNIFLLKSFYHANKIFFTSEYGYICVATPHEASADNPLNYTRKYIDSTFKIIHLITIFFSEHQEIYDNENIFLAKMEHRFNRYLILLPHLAKLSYLPVSPFSDNNIDDVILSPVFFKFILNHYAELYAKYIGYIPTFPKEESDPLIKEKKLEDELIPIVFYPKKENKIKLSIIIPAYNVELYISRCLDSVVSQYYQNIEIILIEDCSKDNTLSICYKYARDYSNIKFYRTKENIGLGKVRNLALQKATGKYITFIDSDDWIEANFFYRAIYLMDKNEKCDIGDFSYYDVDEKMDCKIRKNIMPNMIVEGKEAIQLYIKGTYKNYGAWSKIYKKDFLNLNSIVFSEFFNEDESFLLQSYSKANFVIFSDIFAYNYVRNLKTPTIMRPKHRGKKYFESTIKNLEIIYDLFKQFPKEKNQELLNDRLYSYRWGHHRDNILLYIYTCKKLNYPSPLSDNVLKTLTFSKIFVRNILTDHALLSEEIKHSIKESKQTNIENEHVNEKNKKETYKIEGKNISINTSKIIAENIKLEDLIDPILWEKDQQKATIFALERSGYFDNEYYKNTYPDVSISGMNSVSHYVIYGANEGRNPTEWFNTSFYVDNNLDVKKSGINPFLHYIINGIKEGRRPF